MQLARRSSFRRKGSSGSGSGSSTRHPRSDRGAAVCRSAASALHAATANGHLESVKLLLLPANSDAAPAKIDALDAQGVTALYVAACNGFADIVRLLLRRGADVDFRDPDGETPLYVATLNGFLEIVVLLVDVGSASVDLCDADGVTPLCIACESGHLDVARALLARGASATKADAAGDTPLHVAAQNGHAETVGLLLTQRAADVDCGNASGVTALFAACENGFLDVARLLLSQGGSNVDAADCDGVTPLSMACNNGHLDVAQELIEQGATVDTADADGATALYFAAQNGHSEIVQLLLESGADVDAADSVGVTALNIASQNGHVSVIEALLGRGAHVDHVDSDGDTALIVASQYGHAKVVELLARRGAAIDFPDADGATPLYLASQNGHAGVVTLLLQCGAEPDFAEGDGATPLYAAAYNGHSDVVRSLLARGARADFVAEVGVTPLYAAAFNGYSEIARILLAKGVQVDFTTAVGVTPLYIASQNGFPGVVAVLLEGGADVDLAVPSGATSLYIAAQNGHLAVADMLLRSGASADLADADGATPLYIACQNGHGDVAQLLLSQAVDVNRATPIEGVAPLYIAAQSGHAGVVEILLARHARVDIAATNGATPLFVVAQSGFLEIATILLEAGASVSLAAANGTTPLYAAAQNGHGEIVERLLQFGADVDCADKDGDSALMVAAQNGHVDVVDVLLKSSATVNHNNAAGMSPLHAAAQSCRREVAELLLHYGAEVDQCASDGSTPLCAGALRGYLDVVTLLLDQDAEIDLALTGCPTPLYAAAYNGHVDVAVVLLDHGAAIDSAMADGTTPLYIAAQNGHFSVVKLLLDRGASIDFATKDCSGPIYIACQNGHRNVAELLIRRGARVNAAGPRGSTPLLVASEFGHLDIARFLACAGAMVNAADRDGNTPLIIASTNGHGEIVKTLLEGSVAIETKNGAGETAVLAAGSQGQFEVVKILIDAGASIHVKAMDGTTLLISAARWSELDFVSWLAESGRLKFATATDPASEAPLIPSTLQTLDWYGANLCEFQAMWHSAVERLKSTHIHLEEDRVSDPVLVQHFVMMVFRMLRLNQLCKETNIFTRIAISARVLSSIEDFHTEMDFLDRRVRRESAHSENWIADIHTQLGVFSRDILPSDEQLYAVLRDEASVIEAISLLQHEISAHSDKHSEKRLELMEFCLDKLLSLSDVHVRAPQSWFVPRHEVVVEQSSVISRSGLSTFYTGKWMSSVVVVAEYSETHDNFSADAETWYELSHPNVVSLFGASSLSLPHLAVFENAASLHLREYLIIRETSGSVWQKLLEVALGLKYLHERGIILGKLSCDSIWVGTDGVAKVCGFGLEFYFKLSADGLDSVRWTSPEVLRDETPASASDVYSLGMCIVEAVTGQAPWGDESCEQVRSLVRWGFRPPRPTAMTVAQWRLIQCMCIYDPAKRLRLVSVLEHLRYFATQELEAQRTGSAMLTAPMSKMSELRVSVEDFLTRLRSKCLLCRSARDSVLYVHARLLDIHRHLEEMHKLPTDVAVTKFCEVLLSVDTFVRVAVSEDSVVRRARSQKVALRAHVHHKEIDELVEFLNIAKVGSIHDWQQKEAQFVSRSFRRINSDEAHPLNSDAKSEDALGSGGVRILRFESKHVNEKFNPTRFELVDRRIREPAQPPWFIPMHELKFQQDGYITAGSFGAVYHGSWLGTPVVVKLMGYEDEANGLDFFLHELRVWYPLSHPHVIKLYGACQIGKRFFVCEYAPGGTLRESLHVSKGRRVTWQKLHEVALGVQYLHELNIVHNDLKCDNFLIGSDGKAKVADFGLSCIPNSAEVKIDIKVQGAQHWKSPEHLRGERPTKASDVYSLGMCILEAVTGEAPWGTAVDAAVRLYLRKGRLPLRPAAMSDDQWDLIEMMCASDPSRRIKIQSVVERLDEFAKQEENADKCGALEPNPEP